MRAWWEAVSDSVRPRTSPWLVAFGAAQRRTVIAPAALWVQQALAARLHVRTAAPLLELRRWGRLNSLHGSGDGADTARARGGVIHNDPEELRAGGPGGDAEILAMQRASTAWCELSNGGRARERRVRASLGRTIPAPPRPAGSPRRPLPSTRAARLRGEPRRASVAYATRRRTPLS